MTIYVEAFGQHRMMIEVCAEHGIHTDTFRWRLKKGMSVEQALTSPVQKRKSISGPAECLRHDEKLVKGQRFLGEQKLTTWRVTKA